MATVAHTVASRWTAAVQSTANNMDAVDAVRTFFLFATCTTLSVSGIPYLRARFVDYGPRATDSSRSASAIAAPRSPLTRFIDYLAAWRVPHSYFIHFYVLSVLSSIFWATQLLSRGPAFRVIAARVNEEHRSKSMSLNQVWLCWALMAIQGARRLYECIATAKQSSSQMWFVHWGLGLAFYMAMTLAIWIEGTGTLLARDITLDHLRVTNVPTPRTLLCLPLFLLASGLQHDCHHYLASLKKYTLPAHPLFLSVICPHYTAECVIYLALALLAAPAGESINKTVLSGLFFVAVNLGITAASSKRWYMQKFGEENVRNRWRMIPFLY
ncbi:hypothetical protein DTO164E3_2979 [Paecilomyces variotii]|nr:hypothetical protein DTO164E3_2979 [Paecilomyces variotii]KAJ9209109.1 hypothetical protein DTO032I3_326 [Paecilomyces variotii]KAJ9282989.1 hypothetical protein DTO021D3_326 [Paecilomyces variotii]KAJ9343808.1 hypothetical protein DTO027B6_3633 [Paecilomyces variotii]KAJ9386989.1 hypothetical protein DTO032I4_3433 [Paecilomyces variotii]